MKQTNPLKSLTNFVAKDGCKSQSEIGGFWPAAM
jgi:hypothetical protein